MPSLRRGAARCARGLSCARASFGSTRYARARTHTAETGQARIADARALTWRLLLFSLAVCLLQNHLVHIDRCLDCLFAPFTHAPPALRDHCTRTRPSGLGGLTLRHGDFIEDRFGVEQRAVLSSLHAAPEEELLEAFDFFGSYILEETAAVAANDDDDDDDEGGPPTVCELLDDRGRASHVAHIDGRGAKPRAWLSQLPRL